MAVAGGSPGRFGEIQIWDVAKKKLTQSIPTTYDTVYGISWSPDGSKIAFGCADNTLRAIDASSGKQVLYQGAHTDWVLGTAFSRDGLFLASISWLNLCSLFNPSPEAPLIRLLCFVSTRPPDLVLFFLLALLTCVI
ncbi:MAG: WD40 repeat domain-containing protein [Planctomycetia bacterium]